MGSPQEIIEKARGRGPHGPHRDGVQGAAEGSWASPRPRCGWPSPRQEAVAVSAEIGYPVRAQGVVPRHQPQERRRRGQGGPQGRRGSGRRLPGHHGLVPRERIPTPSSRASRCRTWPSRAWRSSWAWPPTRSSARCSCSAWAACGWNCSRTSASRSSRSPGATPPRPSASIRAARLLEGFRGSDPVDKAALEDILLRVSEFVAKTPEVAEMDLNPIFAYADGAVAVDARVILGA